MLAAAVALHSREVPAGSSRACSTESSRQRAPRPPCWSSCGTASASSPKICMPSTGAVTLRWQRSSAPQASRRAAVRLRASQTRLPRSTGLRSGPAVTQLRSHFRPTKSMHGGSALGITKRHHHVASRTIIQTFFSISASPLSERTVVVLTTCFTTSAPPLISPSPAASGSSLKFFEIWANPRLCLLC